MFALNVQGEPGEWKLFIFSKVEKLVWRPFPECLRQFISTILFRIAPAIPTDLQEFLKPKRRRNAFLLAALATFVAGLVVQVAWAFALGTFRGPDPKRLYLSQDFTNLANYAFVCPVYVGLSAVMFLLVGGYWFRLKRIPIMLGHSEHEGPSLSIAGAIVITLAAGAVNTCKYIAECLDPSISARIPWYITSVTSDGQRVLGAFGVYYTLLNFCLFVVVILALLAFLSFFGLAVRVAAAIRCRPAASKLDFQKIKHSLEGFLLAYIVAKLMVAVLIVNFYTWQWSQTRVSFTFVFMGVALTFFGVFIASLPRYVLELEWFRFKLKNALALDLPIDELDADDMRPTKIRVAAGLLDAVFIGNFVISCVQAVRSLTAR